MKLLVYKYIGGLLVIFILSGFTIGGVWLVTALQSGHWDPRFSPHHLLDYVYLRHRLCPVYCHSSVYLAAPSLRILITLAFMLVLYVVGTVKTVFDANKIVNGFTVPEWGYDLVDALNNCLPRYKDMDMLGPRGSSLKARCRRASHGCKDC